MQYFFRYSTIMFEIIPEQEINQSESVHKTSDASSGNESGLFSGIYGIF